MAVSTLQQSASDAAESTRTPSGISLPLVATASDHAPDDSLPGQYPFTRGIFPDGFRGRTWTMRQYAGFGSAEESNRRYRFLLDGGQTGLSVALDLPTQCGYDPIDPIARPEVGKVGAPLSNLSEREILFDGIDLSKISTSFTANGTAAVQSHLNRRCPCARRRLYSDRGDGLHARQRLTYVDELIERGGEVAKFAKRLSFFFYVHMDFFEEVCKFRADRRLWARLLKERYGVTDEKALMFRFGVVCGGSSLTAAQPYNNVARVAVETMAAVLGGAQSIFTAAFDEALRIPTEFSSRPSRMAGCNPR